MRDHLSDAAIGLLVIAAILSLLHLLTACASGPQGLAQTTPQACSVVIDSHDGGSVTISGTLAIYARGTGDADQRGTEASAHTQSQIDSTVDAR